MAGRTIAIGDIHGCAAALAALVEAIRPGPDDTLVPLGDYIDRGPNSRGVLDRLIALPEQCRLVPLLGNHEEMLVASLSDVKDLEGWLACGGLEMLRSYGWSPGQRRGLDDIVPEAHWHFLAGCQKFYETETHLFVHAGYVPDLPLEKQPAEALRWKPLNRRRARPHCSGKTAVVGHMPQRRGEVLDLGFLKCIDTACHSGKWLTALDVDTGQVWQADHQGRPRRAGGGARLGRRPG
jgi:serine/threonine protein phosphatase 1